MKWINEVFKSVKIDGLTSDVTKYLVRVSIYK